MDLRSLDRSCKDFYVIAEIGNNHRGSLALCQEYILEAKLAGANAVKLQMRDNKSLFTKKFYNSPYDNPNSFGNTYGEHREAVELSPAELVCANEYAHSIGVDFICTAFDLTSAKFVVNDLNCDSFKLASSDLCNPTLLEFFCTLNKPKPLILSTGGHSLDDVRWVFNKLSGYSEDVSILHCVSSYPADHSLLNLRSIKSIKEIVSPKWKVGYSSHDNGVSMPLVACVLGAEIIEKHFTLNRASKGTDHAMSANPTMLKSLVRDLKYLELCLGSEQKPVHSAEYKALTKMMKSPYFASDLPAGSVLSKDHLIERIPFTGLTLRECYETCLGKIINTNVEFEQALSYELLD